MDRGAASGTSEETPDGMTLVQAFVPYILLTAVTMVVLVVPPVNRFLNPGVHWIFLSGDFHGVWIRQPGYGTIFAVAALYPCQYVPVSVIHCRAGVFRQARMDSSGRRKRVFVRSITMSHAVGNRYHRSCHYVQNHGRNRADQRAGGRDSKGTWQDLCHIGASGGNGGIVHDRKQYVI